MVHFNTLPPEILALIFQPSHFDAELGCAQTGELPPRQDPLQICLVCRTWLDYGLSLLYHTIAIALTPGAEDPEDMESLPTSLSSPHLRAFVRSLDVFLYDPDYNLLNQADNSDANNGQITEVEMSESAIVDKMVQRNIGCRVLMRNMEQLSGLESLNIICNLSKVPMLEAVLNSIPTSTRRLGIIFKPSEVSDIPLQVDTAKLLRFIQIQGNHLGYLALYFRSGCQISTTTGAGWNTSFSIRELKISQSFEGYPRLSDLAKQKDRTILQFFELANPRALRTLSVPMTLPFMETLASRKTLLQDLTFLEFDQRPWDISSKELREALSILFPQLQIKTLQLQSLSFIFSLGSSALPAFLASFPSTLTTSGTLDSTMHAEIVGKLWRQGKFPYLKTMDMICVSMPRAGACELERACWSKIQWGKDARMEKY